ncbi:hypothetical protein LTR81_025133 [Elasticomyces elasticus]
MGSQLDVVMKGVVVSSAWLVPKSARADPFGPVDNFDIVPQGASEGRHLSDEGRRNGGSRLRRPVFQESLGQRCGQVRHGSGQHQIDRYAIDTAPDGSTQRNIVYGHYPLIVTVRKVPHPSRENDRAPTPASTSAVQNLKKEVAERDLQPKRGQKSPDDAVKLVVSRADGVQRFVGRANEAAGVLPATKLRIWRVLDVQDGTVNTSKAGVLSPLASRSTSPSKYQLADLKEMGVCNQVQRFDINDETKNAKYNGKSTVETHGFFRDQTMLLEKMSGGPAGGEFESDQMKRTSKFKFGGKTHDSKAASTAKSRGASPAPGG